MGENKQAEKTAIVFDTNFIVEKLDQLIQVVKVLREKKYELYISQVVIDERKAQLCNEKKEKYNKIHDLAKYLTNYIEIKSKIPSSNHIDEIQKN